MLVTKKISDTRTHTQTRVIIIIMIIDRVKFEEKSVLLIKYYLNTDLIIFA